MIGMETKGYSLCRVQGAPEDSLWGNSDRSEMKWSRNIAVSPHPHQGTTRPEKRALSFLHGCGEHRWNPLAACYRTLRRQNVFTSGFVSGCFYSSVSFCFQADQSLSCEMFCPQIRI